MNDKTTKQIRTLSGTVISDKMDKTVSVRVSRVKRHPKYLKRYQTRTTYLAHDPQNAAKVGDVVQIRADRPRSKRKRWIVVSPRETKS